MAKDYYKILGVKKTDSRDTIKKAYRDAVKRLHPDVKGGKFDKRRFYEVQEAYETLGNDEKRRKYDRKQDTQSMEKRKGQMNGKTFFDRVDPFEALFSQFGLWPTDHKRAEEISRPSAMGKTIHRAKIILTPDEAQRGGSLTLQVPITRSCILCDGRGMFGLFSCPVCGGRGEIPHTLPVRIHIPSNIQEGSTLKIPFEDSEGIQHILILFIEIDWFT